MAMTINSNVYAMNAQRSLSMTQGKLGTSLERLSSGLRINRAADDASGLAISEKLRGQISGLKRASMNAQDGISMLQTAEGGLSEISSMLQRMRELAVQASNGIYTTEDRAEIQKEVDQLKDEIDRISSSTEFNTRKLLNGDATALWSADTDKVSAIIRGDVAQGNYEIQLSTTPGQGQIQSTDIMTLNEGAIGTEIVTDGAASANETNVSFVKDPSTLEPTGTSYYTVDVIGDYSGGAASAAATLAGTYLQDGSLWNATNIASSTTTTGVIGGYVEVEFLAAVTAGGTGAYRYRFVDSFSEYSSTWYTGTSTVNGIENITISNSSTTAVSFTGQITDLDIGLSYTNINKGDKLLFSVYNGTGAVDYGVSGGGTIQLSGGPDGVIGPRLIFSGATTSRTLTPLDNGDIIADYKDTVVHVASLDDSTGNLNYGSMTFSFSEQVSATGVNGGQILSGDLSVQVLGGGEAATTTTKLKDISRFVDADGNNVLDNKQEITIFGGGRQATIFIEGNDTIAELEQKLTDAIVDDLDMGADDTNLNNHLVDYISSPASSGTRAVKGTFVIQTALTGEQGEINFIADQAVIDALSLNVAQQPTNNVTEVTIRNAETGDLIGQDETGDDRIYGIIDGIEVALDSRAGVTASWDATRQEVVFAENTNASTQRYHLHVVGNATELQIGANEGQNIDVSIPQLDARGLGVDNVLMVSQEAAQRAIPDIDEALQQLVSTRATIGAQVSRLEHSIVNLETARENMMASESRIRDLDIASETTDFTKAQILSQSGVAMLAQANQVPQMALQLLQF